MGIPLVLLLVDLPTRDPVWMTTSWTGGEKHATGDHVSGPESKATMPWCLILWFEIVG